MDIVNFKQAVQTTDDFTQKDNIFLVDMEGVNVSERLTSKTHEHTLTDDYRFVEIENHEFDYELVEKTGLGVATINDNPDVELLYNPNEHDSMDNEVVRYGVYYQLTHEQFDDKQLERVLMQDVIGKVFMEMAFGEHMDELYNRLKKVFDKKKNNVVTLKRGSK